MRETKTYFEQVPIEEAKRIAEREIERAKKKVIEIDSLCRVKATKKTEPYSVRIGVTSLEAR